MAKKNNSKVSITKVDAYLKTQGRDPVRVAVSMGGEETLEFEVKRAVELNEFYAMVHAVADAAFVVDEETGLERYDAVYHKYAHDTAILTHVANFKEEMNGEKLFALAQQKAVIQAIMNEWDDTQRAAFDDAVSAQIDFKRMELLATERRQLMKATAQIEVVTESIRQMAATMQGVDMQELLQATQKIANMDEHELGRAVVAARDDDFVEQRRAELQVLK